MSCDTIYVIVLKSHVFCPHCERSIFKTMRLRKSPLLRPLLKASVFITVFDRVSVDYSRKLFRKYEFSNENALVCTAGASYLLEYLAETKGEGVVHKRPILKFASFLKVFFRFPSFSTYCMYGQQSSGEKPSPVHFTVWA